MSGPPIPPPTPAETRKTTRLRDLVSAHQAASGFNDTDRLLRTLDFHSSLERPSLGWVEARVVCAAAAREIRRLRDIDKANP